jgi:hypothetical protein
MPATITPKVEFIPKILISQGEATIQRPANIFKISAEKWAFCKLFISMGISMPERTRPRKAPLFPIFVLIRRKKLIHFY